MVQMLHSPPTESETTAFESARSEILLRISLRDRIVVTSFTLSTAILGGTMLSRDPMLGLLVPVFNMGAALVACAHTAAIHRICAWTRCEIPFNHWARSNQLRDLHRGAIAERALAQAAILVTPAMVALAYGYHAAFARTSVLLSGLWWSGVLMTVTTSAVQWRTLLSVLQVNRETGYQDARSRHQGNDEPPSIRPAA